MSMGCAAGSVDDGCIRIRSGVADDSSELLPGRSS